MSYVKDREIAALAIIKILIRNGVMIPQGFISELKKKYPKEVQEIAKELIRQPIRRKRIERLARIATELYYRPNLEYDYFEGSFTGGALNAKKNYESKYFYR